MKIKNVILMFFMVFIIYSCKEKDEPKPPQLYSEQIVGYYEIIEEAYISKKLDLDVDGDSSTNLFEEPYYLKGYFHGNELDLSYSADRPGYYYLGFNVYYGAVGSWYNFGGVFRIYVLDIDDEAKTISIIERVNENHDINSEKYMYLQTVESDGERAKVVLNQNYWIWDGILNDFRNENVDVTYIWKRKGRYD